MKDPPKQRTLCVLACIPWVYTVTFTGTTPELWDVSVWPLAVSCSASKPTRVAVGPSAMGIGPAAGDRPPTTPGAVASAVFMLLAHPPSSRVCCWCVGATTYLDPPFGFHLGWRSPVGLVVRYSRKTKVHKT